MHLIVALGNQLFRPELLSKQGVDAKKSVVFMREDRELCTYFKFHKQKIVFFLAAMRAYANELKGEGYCVHYESLSHEDNRSYEQALQDFIKTSKVTRISVYEIEDKFFESRLIELFKGSGLEFEIWKSPMFLTTRKQFGDYLGSNRRPFMKTFYESQRRRLKILMESDGPVGGQWSFDVENRKALPRNVTPPPLPKPEDSQFVKEAETLCEAHFSDHPGLLGPTWLPVDRAGARAWLKTFLKERLQHFGPYEDAIPERSEFLFHSVLTPFLNVGLLEPQEVVKGALAHAAKNGTPMASLEGFIRQVIGWREFVRGIYREYSETQDKANHWNHHNRLSRAWYGGKTGVPPLDRALDRVWRHGYLHHIERLMVVGCLMVLLEIEPSEAHRWFMEMFIDSSDWVMGPNVYGMALFSDGGIFATKPYICGSNYYRKMSGDRAGDWCDSVDGLYWSFIRKHKEQFAKNPRMSMMVRALEKIPAERMRRLDLAAEELRRKLVVT